MKKKCLQGYGRDDSYEKKVMLKARKLVIKQQKHNLSGDFSERRKMCELIIY